ncbi:MAG: hypothetical protein H0U53_05185 [Actinobacteria bacterium]|nr:hypothetical protein [Actinomycetota bacterium]
MNLSLHRAIGGGKDRIFGISIVLGSRKSDTLIGHGRFNRFRGNGGNDVLIGRGGVDYLGGGHGNDHLEGGRGSDRLRGSFGVNQNDGGRGSDFCTDPDRRHGAINCERS